MSAAPAKTFTLAGKQLKFDSKKDIESYLAELSAQENVEKIDLNGNTIGIEASEALSKALLKHKDTITEIDFSDIYTGRLNTEIPQSLQHLLPALLQCPNLKTINLSDNAFGLQTIDPIEAWLAQAISIEHLILSNNGMGPFAGERIGKSLFRLAQQKKKLGKPSLKTFVCGRNRLENGSINCLAIGLRNHADLETVRLYQNGIRPGGIAKLIAKGLSQNTKLKVLDLQDNTITTASYAIAENIAKWPLLSELNLNDCLLKGKGGLAIISSLAQGKERPQFTSLKLQYNELGADSLEKLVAAIKEKLTQIKLVEMNGNILDEDDETFSKINSIFEERGFGEFDELDDLEELDELEEEESDDEGDAVVDEDDNIDLDQLEKELAGVSIEDKDSKVDDLASELASTHIKN